MSVTAIHAPLFVDREVTALVERIPELPTTVYGPPVVPEVPAAVYGPPVVPTTTEHVYIAPPPAPALPELPALPEPGTLFIESILTNSGFFSIHRKHS